MLLNRFCTKLVNENGVSVSTVEHLMAAFYGEGVDNVLLKLMLQKYQSWMDHLLILLMQSNLILEEQNEPRKYLKVLKKVELS